MTHEVIKRFQRLLHGAIRCAQVQVKVLGIDRNIRRRLVLRCVVLHCQETLEKLRREAAAGLRGRAAAAAVAPDKLNNRRHGQAACCRRRFKLGKRGEKIGVELQDSDRLCSPAVLNIRADIEDILANGGDNLPCHRVFRLHINIKRFEHGINEVGRRDLVVDKPVWGH